MRLTTTFLLAMLPLAAMACRDDQGATEPIPDGVRTAVPSHRSARPDVSVAVACGASVVADLKLDEDLTCPGDALFVDGDGIKIDLQGHTITGAGVGVGITVRGHHDVSISRGTIQNFLTGVFVATSTDVVIKDNGFTQNREGVFLAGASGNTIKHNTAWQNTSRGFMIRPTGSGTISTDNVVMDNVVTNNPTGILLFGQPGNTLKANTISGSSVAGIDLTGGGASGTIVKDNLLTGNAAAIRFGIGWTDNTILANTIQANSCGITGTTADNLFKENVFSTNTADWCQ
jgi:parallel beta-helix repeat protein